MGYAQAKAIQIKVGGSLRDYMIYEDKGEFYYMTSANYKARSHRGDMLPEGVLSTEEVKWVKSRSWFNKVAPVGLADKIERDKMEKKDALLESIKNKHDILKKMVGSVIVLKRLARRWKNKPKVQAAVKTAADENDSDIRSESDKSESSAESLLSSDLTDDLEDPSAVDESTVDSADEPVPVISSDDTHKQAIYDELQAIATILAGLKGNEPQLKQVRVALQNAMDETGIQASAPEPTVGAPGAGMGAAPTSNTHEVPEPDDEELSPVEKTQKNIAILTEVKDRINTLLINHQDKIDEPLSRALNDLSSAVGDSIYEAQSALRTQQAKEALNAAIPTIPTIPTTSLEMKPDENKEDDDATLGRSNTPGYNN